MVKRKINDSNKEQKLTVIKTFFSKSFCKDEKVYNAIQEHVLEMSTFFVEYSYYFQYIAYTHLHQGTWNDFITSSKNIFMDLFYHLKQKSKDKYQLNTDYELLRIKNNLSKYNVVCSNSMIFLATQYETILKNNIFMHAYNRIRKFFKNHTKQESDIYTPTIIYKTLDVLFNKKSTNKANEYLLQLLKTILHFDMDNFYDIEQKPLKYIPLFFNLQKYNENRNLKNFTLIPQIKSGRKYIRYDSCAFFTLLASLKLLDKGNTLWSGFVPVSMVYWKKYFNIEKFETSNKKFS